MGRRNVPVVAEKGLQWFLCSFVLCVSWNWDDSIWTEKPGETYRPSFETTFPAKFIIVTKIQILQLLFENRFKLVTQRLLPQTSSEAWEDCFLFPWVGFLNNAMMIRPDVWFLCVVWLNTFPLSCLILSRSQECVTWVAESEPNMTYECMNVKERLGYVRAHLVCTPHGAGKEIHSKMLVKTFLDWRVFTFTLIQDLTWWWNTSKPFTPQLASSLFKFT